MPCTLRTWLWHSSPHLQCACGKVQWWDLVCQSPSEYCRERRCTARLRSHACALPGLILVAVFFGNLCTASKRLRRFVRRGWDRGRRWRRGHDRVRGAARRFAGVDVKEFGALHAIILTIAGTRKFFARKMRSSQEVYRAAFFVFSDETWVNGTPPYRQWLTIHSTENPQDFAEIRERPQGWMSWGSIHGRKKGPHQFWEKSTALAYDEIGQPILVKKGKNKGQQEKEWGYMNARKYCSKILILVKAYLEDYDLDVKFQQDNASIHACAETVEWMKDKGIWGRVIWWPSKSPDLNPIE